MSMRPLRVYRQISRTLDELEGQDRVAGETARLELTRSASHFSQRSKQVVENTVGLSALLMRAGEVEEAQRLLVEAGRDVEEEKERLAQRVTSLERARRTRKKRMAQLRVAKMLLAALIGTVMMAFPAAGMVVTNYLTERDAKAGEVQGAASRNDSRYQARKQRLHEIDLAGLTLKLTATQYDRFSQLKAAGAGDAEVANFLIEVLPAGLAEKVAALLAPAQPAVAKAKKVVDPVLAAAKTQTSAATGSTRPSDTSQSAGSEGETGSNDSGEASSSDEGTEGEDPSSCDENERTPEGGRSLGGGNEENNEESEGSAINPECVPVVGTENPIG